MNGCALLEGLRLGDGRPILRAGKDRAAVQLRVTDDDQPMAGGGGGARGRKEVPEKLSADPLPQEGGNMPHFFYYGVQSIWRKVAAKHSPPFCA